MSADQAHEHRWQNGPLMEQDHVQSSPCSRADDHLWTLIIQVQTCECGETRRLALGYKNRRRRGDDARKARGLPPLGIPLQRSETFAKPKVLR